MKNLKKEELREERGGEEHNRSFKGMRPYFRHFRLLFFFDFIESEGVDIWLVNLNNWNENTWTAIKNPGNFERKQRDFQNPDKRKEKESEQQESGKSKKKKREKSTKFQDIC